VEWILETYPSNAISLLRDLVEDHGECRMNSNLFSITLKGKVTLRDVPREENDLAHSLAKESIGRQDRMFPGCHLCFFVSSSHFLVGLCLF
jgi:hypothetical protein